MQTERQFPYTVAITITKAEKLRIADITSSDPYVKISIGGRHIGQTAFKPSTLNPVWNEHFTCPLLHLQSSVLLQVMDHDDYNTDDAMGVAEVELSTMPVNCIIEVKRPLQNVGNIVAKGSIFLTVLVEKATDLIKIEYITKDKALESQRIPQRKQADIAALSFELAGYRLSLPLREALMCAPSTLNRPRLDWMFVKDMLCDVAMLSSQSDQFARDAQRRYVIRQMETQKSFSQSTRMDLKQNRAAKSFPIQDKYVILLETDTDIHYIVAQSFLHQWAWTRAFQKAMDGTASQVRVNGTLGIRVEGAIRECRCHFSSLATQVSNINKEIICEDIADSTIIRLNISTLRAITVANDYSFVKQYELVVELVSGILEDSNRVKLEPSMPHRRFHSSAMHSRHIEPAASPAEAVQPRLGSVSRKEEVDFYFVGDETSNHGNDAEEIPLAPTYIEDTTHSGKRKWYPGKMLFRGGKATAGFVLNTVGSTASATVNIVSSVAVGAGVGVVHVAEGAVGVVKGVGKTGVKVVKGTVKGVVATAETTVDLATGKDSAGRVANIVGRSVKDSVTSVAAISLDIAQGRLKQEVKSQLIVRSPYTRDVITYPVVGTNPFWNETYTLTLSEDDLKQCLSDESLGLAIFLVQGEDVDILSSSTFIPIRSLLVTPDERQMMLLNQLSVADVFPSVFPNGRSGETPLIMKEIPFGAPYVPPVIDVPTGQCCQCLEYTVIGASNLAYAADVHSTFRESSNKFSSMFTSDSQGSMRSLQAVATLVKWMGQDRGVRFKRRKTNVAKVDYNNPNPIWNETVNVTESEGLEWATYIRIEVFDLNKPKEEGGRLGAAFIPIDTIPTEAANVKDYPLTPHRSPESYVRWHRMAGTEYGMGSVTVRCQRKLYRTAESNGSVIIRSQLREVGTLDTFWRAKSVLSGSLFIVDSVKITEECNVFASLDGLYVDVVTKNYKDIISNPLKYFTVDASTMLVARNEDEKHEEHSHGILNIFHSSASSSRRRKSSSAEAVPSTGGNNIFAVGRSAFNRTAAEAQFHKDQENFGFLIEVFCFENQRKGFSNKEFSASNLLVTERPWLSDETGMIPFPFESLEACNPPDGYEWLEDKWGRDFEYTACDDEGWSYSADFINIMANLKKNDSNKEDKNFFVRRRKWGRFARRLFYPRSGMTLCEMRSALAGSTTLNSQLEPIPFPSNSLNRQQVFEREGDGSVLALCLERGSSDENGNCSGPVIIPWNQVMSIHVITPTVLSLVVEIRRYLGSAASLSNDQSKTENFVNAQCELFLYNCPADDLSLMLNERMSVSEAREELHSLLVSKHINGSEGVERDAAEVQNGNHGDAAGWVEGEATGNLEDDLDDITASIALSKASVLMSKLDEAVMLMETKMSKLEKKHGSSVSLIEEYDLLTLRISRLMLYLAALLGAGLQGGEASLETYEKDRSVAESLHTSALQRGADPVSASIDQVNFLLDAMEGRVRNLSLTGFKMKNDELDRLLSELMNAYYVEIIRVLAVFFDSLKKMEAINGHAKKLELITFLIDNDDRVQLAVDGALRPYSRKSTPKPFLSAFLDISKFIGWYSVLLHKEMKLWVDRCFASSSEYDMSESEYKYHLPWEPIPASSSYTSHLRIDLVGSLKTFLDMPRPVPTPLTSQEMNVTIDILNKAIVSAYGACFLHVATRLREVLLSSEWASPPSSVHEADEQAVFDSISGQMFWLCSVANDAAFYNEHVKQSLESSAAEMKAVQDKVKAEVTRYGREHVGNNAERQLELSNSVNVVLHESQDAFEDVRNISADFLSCIIFKSFIDLLLHDNTAEWIQFCRRHANLDGSLVSHVSAGVSKVDNVEDSEIVEKSSMDTVLESIAIDFESYRQYVNLDCYENLVKICTDKFVMRYYGLLRGLAAEKIIFSAVENVQKMRDELNKISKFMCRAIHIQPGDESEYSAIVTKFGLLYDALALIEEESENEQLRLLKVMKNFAHNNPDLAKAVASFARVCISLKPDYEELFNAETSLIPDQIQQIEAYCTFEPPPKVEKKKHTEIDDSDEFQDLEAVAEAAASEARKKQLRPDPLELVFGNSSISLFPIKDEHRAPRRHSLLGIWGSSGNSSGSQQFSAALVDEKIKVALLNCTSFYKERPAAVIVAGNLCQSAADVVTTATVVPPAVTKEEKKLTAEAEKKSNFFTSMFTKHRSEKVLDAAPTKQEEDHKHILLSKVTAKTPAVPYIDISELMVHNLFSTDTLFSSVPNSFVQISVGRSTINTEVFNNNADPRWTDPQMKIGVPAGFAGNSELKLSLFYKKRLGQPELIGNVSILLAKFEASLKVEDTYEINFSNSSDHVVNCFVKSTASGVPPPTIKIIAALIKE